MSRLIAFFIVVALVLSPAVSSAARKPAKKEEVAVDPSVPPKDAQWTIYCQAIAGPDHVQRADAVKAELLRSSGLKDWYVIHGEGESVVYYGFYRSINDDKDKKESTRAQQARQAIDGLKDALGNKVFRHCFFVAATTPDPAAPPEWDLRNAKGYWSLEIGGFKDSPQRKQAAVDAVREARKQGIDAYYFHGPSTSSVCIGTWPREAVREQDEESGLAPDVEQDVLVLPQPLAGMGNVEIRNRDGRRVRALAPRTEYTDQSLVAAIAKYPSYAVNGVETVEKMQDANGQMRDVPKPSLLVVVPRNTGPSLLRNPNQPPPPSLVGPTAPSQQPGTGTLRSIGQ